MPTSEELIRKVCVYAKSYMNNFDGSHDFNHVKRVLGTSRQILAEMGGTTPANDTALETRAKLDPTTITLVALLHDVGDRKYLKDGEDGHTMVRDLLLSFGSDPKLAETVQTICLGVAYSTEIKDRAFGEQLIEQYPELAVVQDADRLDSIGAIGIGRVFSYGAANLGREMGESMEILDVKLFKLEAMMKTDPGRRMARERTKRLRVFKEWWGEEMKAGNILV